MKFQLQPLYTWQANIFEAIWYGMKMHLSMEKIDNKKCYVITSLGDSLIQYIDQETLLPVRIESSYIDESEYTLVDEVEFDGYFE